MEIYRGVFYSETSYRGTGRDFAVGYKTFNHSQGDFEARMTKEIRDKKKNT